MGDFFTVVSLVAFVVLIATAIRLMRASVSVTRRSKRWLVWSGATWVGAFVLSLVSGGPAASDPAPGADGTPIMSVAGYEQTWTKGYTKTTCEEFADEMTSRQQLAAAADMLTLVWIKIEATRSWPGDTLIHEYRDAVATRCDTPTETIAEVAWSIWINDPRFAA